MKVAAGIIFVLYVVAVITIGVYLYNDRRKLIKRIRERGPSRTIVINKKRQ